MMLMAIAKKLKGSESESNKAAGSATGDVVVLQSGNFNYVESALVSMSPQLTPLITIGSPTRNGQVAEAEQLLRATTQRCHAFISSVLAAPQPASSGGDRGIRSMLHCHLL